MVMEEKLFDFDNFVVCVDPVLEEWGINVGDTLFLIGDGFVPQEDPYNFRKAFLALPVKNDHIVTTQKPWAIDPKTIKHVDDNEQARLTAIKEKDFAPKEEQGAVGTA